MGDGMSIAVQIGYQSSDEANTGVPTKWDTIFFFDQTSPKTEYRATYPSGLARPKQKSWKR